MGEKFTIVIIGAGPAGLSAAARAAELGVSHLLLEGAERFANTVHRYQKGKRVMAEPAALPLRSALRFAAGSRERVLETWQQDLAVHGVRLRTEAPVAAISGRRGRFVVHLASGEGVEADFVVVAVGLQGNLRQLGIPGEELPQIQYQLADPNAHRDETIVVVGGGDAGIEDALALAGRNRVLLVNRQEEFSNCREANALLLRDALRAGRLEVMSGASVIRAEAGGALPLSLTVQSGEAAIRFDCHRVIARLGAAPPRQLLEAFGVAFPTDDPAAVPALSAHYESNVSGLYIIGALAGYPLIKQALNQGFEVVEYILGKAVEPADEALLAAKFARVPGIGSVAAGIEALRDGLPLLAELMTLQLREFMFDSEILAPQPGEIVVRRNDYSNSFVSILRGSVQVRIDKADGTTRTFRLGRGEFFGEIGLLSGRRRSGTVVAGADCVLVETPRRSMLKLMDHLPGVERKLDEVALKRVVQNCFGGQIDAAQVDDLVAEATTRRFDPGEVVFREGDRPDGLYLIRRGSVTVSRTSGGKEQVSAYVSAGNYFGEMALVSQKPRTATIRAAARTEVVLLEAGRFADLLGRNPAVLGKVTADYLERVRRYESVDAAGSSEMLHFLIDQGIGEATDVMLIDYARCVRCDNCEAACADAHGGTSRLRRQGGQTFEQVHVPASCRHCEHPRCMKDCPPDAIRRSPGGEVFIGESCIGCGNCQVHCAYGVIQMAAARPLPRPGPLARLFRRGVAAAADEGEKRAVKCDMCMGIVGGPACVRACPTGAAFRASPEEFLEILGGRSPAPTPSR